MPPKKNNNNSKKGGKKQDDDDFDTLLAQAVKETKSDAVKNHKNNANHNKSDENNAQKYKSYADKDAVVPSKADHPENPYPPAVEGGKRQTWPEPTLTIKEQFPSGKGFPAGPEMPYTEEMLKVIANDSTQRVTSEEERAMKRASQAAQLEDLREAAEVHRQVRTWAHSWIKPGLPLIYITDKIEKKLNELIVKDGIVRGQAFPTGISINHCAAHFTPNHGEDEKIILEYDDVMKIDFGTQINGRIIDCAWTYAANEVKYENLLKAVRESTYEGIKQAGVDVRLCDVGAAIEEVMESYEVEINNKVFPVKSIRNLCGHNIAPYFIHGGKSVPIIKGGEQVKMEEGELFAIETFGSTGKGYVSEEGDCSHYMLQRGMEGIALRSDKAAQLLKHIQKHYSTLAFCRKWLDRDGQDRHLLYLNQLCDSGAVHRYPPLCDVRGSYTAQVEHTIFLKEGSKEIISKGEDY
ncbi:methionyl aminopeptidase [Angomonas deanei]|uniref:Methionine aminopeptidase 2 n=1 Tax=Angomonas deanei TaxID=59799 RepID=A0A7G2CPU5_9TRYP|nr:methionyl aminopeptidase [Angomonas deanei]CAD2220991.1 Metallopeptidase family M24, putative [Angomonas deanei]|eukprot:EPY31476.1 methionyl aminopeptidase [Angomonas deanei]